jgi:hypothetical protein
MIGQNPNTLVVLVFGCSPSVCFEGLQDFARNHLALMQGKTVAFFPLLTPGGGAAVNLLSSNIPAEAQDVIDAVVLVEHRGCGAAEEGQLEENLHLFRQAFPHAHIWKFWSGTGPTPPAQLPQEWWNN